jgi:hypothetical protein
MSTCRTEVTTGTPGTEAEGSTSESPKYMLTRGR